MTSPDQSSAASLSLHIVLRSRRTAALIGDAEVIRDAELGRERDDEARRSIREAMLLFALHRITAAERDRVLDILSFAKVAHVPPAEETSPYRDFDAPHAHDPLV